MDAKRRLLGWSGIACLTLLAACGGGGGGSSAPAPAGTIQITATAFDATEGTVVNILVSRSGGTNGAVSVDFAASAGSAREGSDYPASSGTLSWPNGVGGNRTISIAITDDAAAESPESFTVTLSNASGARLGTNTSAIVTIIDNDSAALPITANNAEFILVDVLEAITSTVELVDLVELVGIPPISRIDAGIAGAPPALAVTETVACDSGEATVTWNDADNNLLISTGDTFDIAFAQCFFQDSGATIDGAVSLSHLVVAGDPVNGIAPWVFAATFGFDNLTATEGGGPASINGSLDISLSSDNNVVANVAIGTPMLTVQQSGDTATLSDYALNTIFDLNALTQVISARGTLASNFIDGNVTFETLQDFVVVGDDNPSAGQLLIKDNTSSVLVTVLDNVNLQLDIDLDLDGTVDETIVIAWSDLDID